MKDIMLEIEEPFNLSGRVAHHTFDIGFPRKVIQAVATGTLEYWIGDTEGTILFSDPGGVHAGNPNTTLVSGGDGTTTWIKVTATYTATFATVIAGVYLYATKNSRANSFLFSSKDIDPDQSLTAGQTYTINWAIHADI